MSTNKKPTDISEAELYQLMSRVYQASKESTHTKSQVACVLKLKDGTLIERKSTWLFYLDPAHDLKTKIGSSSPTKHAETSAIAAAAQQGKSTQGAKAFLDVPPCPNCMNALVAAGVTDIYVSEEGFDPKTRAGEWYSRRGYHFRATSLQIAANAGVKIHKVKIDQANKRAISEEIELPAPTEVIDFQKTMNTDQIDADTVFEARHQKQGVGKTLLRQAFAQIAGTRIADYLGVEQQEGSFGISYIHKDDFDLDAYKSAMRQFLKEHRSKNVGLNGDNALAALIMPPEEDNDHYTIVMATSISTIGEGKKRDLLKADPGFLKVGAYEKKRKELEKYKTKIYPVDHLRSILARLGTPIRKGSHLIASGVPSSHEQVGLHDVMEHIQLHILSKKRKWMPEDKSALKLFDQRGISLLLPPEERTTNDLTQPSSCALAPHMNPSTKPEDREESHCECC